MYFRNALFKIIKCRLSGCENMPRQASLYQLNPPRTCEQARPIPPIAGVRTARVVCAERATMPAAGYWRLHPSMAISLPIPAEKRNGV
jgi:hypothetical protein